MNRIQTLDATTPNVVARRLHAAHLQHRVDGLNVTGLDLTGPFALVDPPTLPALVPAGGTLDVKVRFTATSAGTGARPVERHA